MIFDKESETLLKQNILFYKNQIADLENQVNNLKTQLNHATLQGTGPIKNGSISPEELKLIEDNYLREIETLKKVEYIFSLLYLYY